LALDPNAYARIRLDVAHVGSMTALFGNDPAGRVRDMHPHNRASSLARAPSDGLDDHVTTDKTHSHGEHGRRVQEVPLKEANSPPLAYGAFGARAHRMLRSALRTSSTA